MIYNLKQKAYKLEFALKRKENELKYLRLVQSIISKFIRHV